MDWKCSNVSYPPDEERLPVLEVDPLGRPEVDPLGRPRVDPLGRPTVDPLGCPGPGSNRAPSHTPEAEYGRRGHVDRTIRRAWKQAGIRKEAWHGQPIHCTFKTIETEWATSGIGQGVIDTVGERRVVPLQETKPEA